MYSSKRLPDNQHFQCSRLHSIQYTKCDIEKKLDEYFYIAFKALSSSKMGRHAKIKTYF